MLKLRASAYEDDVIVVCCWCNYCYAFQPQAEILYCLTLRVSKPVLVSTLLVKSSHPLNLSIARESITSVIFSLPKIHIVFFNICLPQELSF